MNVKKAKALIAIGADSKQLDKDLADAKKKLKGFKDGAKKLGGKIMGAGKGVLDTVMGGFGIQGAGAITDLVSGVFDLERGLARFQIATGKSNSEMATFRAQVLDVSKATGVASGDILEGAQTYVDLTGDVQGAQAAMSAFARISQASGASVSDVATASAALQQSLGVNAGDIEAVFSGMIMQGKAGAVSLKDFAGQLSSLAPRWAKFAGGASSDGIAQMGAAFQIARQGFKGSSEAATGLEALMGSLSLNAKKFQAAGVKLFDVKKGVKTFRSFDQIIASIGKSKLMKDPTALTKAFGSKEAAQAFDMLNKARTALDPKTGKTLWDQLVGSGHDTGAVQRDMDTYLNSTAGKLDKAFNTLKVTVAEAFTPERIAMFVNALEKALEYAAKLIGYIQDIDNYLNGDGHDSAFSEQIQAGKNEATKRMTAGYVRASGGMTPQQKALAAQQLIKEANSIAGDDDAIDAVQRASRRRAAEQLDPSLQRRPGESVWDQHRRVNPQPISVRTEVKVGGDTIVKAAGNAQSVGTRPGGN